MELLAAYLPAVQKTAAPWRHWEELLQTVHTWVMNHRYILDTGAGSYGSHEKPNDSIPQEQSDFPSGSRKVATGFEKGAAGRQEIPQGLGLSRHRRFCSDRDETIQEIHSAFRRSLADETG
ncbi:MULTISPECIES: hypothetical protein [unclassified Ruegeria]|uniref:hypothetical protein n=1 Tax=unclassified Ruegeria TaxID=2625375 RepID=UPI0020A0286B|nr:MULTISPECIES: hypothetical protein [unclassified Ruegeria]